MVRIIGGDSVLLGVVVGAVPRSVVACELLSSLYNDDVASTLWFHMHQLDLELAGLRPQVQHLST